jgi:hypothetical protein
VTQAIKLEYDNLNVTGPAFVMNIQISGQIVASATVAFGTSQTYLNKPFAVVYGGTRYCGTFMSGTVVF